MSEACHDRAQIADVREEPNRRKPSRARTYNLVSVVERDAANRQHGEAAGLRRRAQRLDARESMLHRFADGGKDRSKDEVIETASGFSGDGFGGAVHRAADQER